MKRSELGV